MSRNCCEIASAAEWFWQRLGLVVVIEAGEVAPALVMAQLDQSRAELDAEKHPAEDDDDDDRRLQVRRSEECGEEPGLAEHRLPSEGVEGLADIDDGEVKRPREEPHGDEERPRRRVGDADEREPGKHDAEPRHAAQEAVGVAPVEERRRIAEADGGEEVADRKEPALAEEGRELVQRGDERDEIDRSESAQEEEANEPEAIEPAHERGSVTT